MKPTTKENVLAAMHGEAFAYAKYMFFARRARERGRLELADLFERTAEQELGEHFEELADLAGLGQSDPAAVADAIAGESYETDKMYREFAAQATQAGDAEAAARFEELAGDELKHRDAFRAALDELVRPASEAVGVG